MPGGTKYEAVTLEQGLSHDLVFERWANMVNSFEGDFAMSLKNYRKNIVINVLNLQGVAAISYKLFRAWVSDYQALPDLDFERDEHDRHPEHYAAARRLAARRRCRRARGDLMKLPGGILRGGQRLNDYSFKALTGVEELAIAEAFGSGMPSPQRVTAVLAAALATIGGEVATEADVAISRWAIASS